MHLPHWLKPGLLATAGAVLLLSGGALTWADRTATPSVSTFAGAQAQAVARQVQLCVQRSRADPMGAAKRAALTRAAPEARAALLLRSGWLSGATLGGSGSVIARACLDALMIGQD